MIDVIFSTLAQIFLMFRHLGCNLRRATQVLSRGRCTNSVQRRYVWSHLMGNYEAKRADFTEIPMINVRPLVMGGTEQDLQSTVSAIRMACMNVGFMYVSHHGVAQSKVDMIFREAKRFF